jgi:hypothetical protein
MQQVMAFGKRRHELTVSFVIIHNTIIDILYPKETVVLGSSTTIGEKERYVFCGTRLHLHLVEKIQTSRVPKVKLRVDSVHDDGVMKEVLAQ